MTRNTITKNNKTTIETRYFISSLGVDVKTVARAIRGHWVVESYHPSHRQVKRQCPTNPNDVAKLEGILWNDLGTKEQYDAQYGKTPLGELVRGVVGLTQKAANDAFSDFLNDAALDSRQIHFVKQIVNYIVKNGIMKDFSILQESPFADYGRVSELFDVQSFTKLRTVIETINANAAA